MAGHSRTNMQPSDPDLLRDWLHRRDEKAFHELVSRYAGLVRATSLRTCGDDSLAAEAAQLTFILLARKAGTLAACASLGGWLHRTAMMQTKNLQRQSRREQRKRDHLAMETPRQSTADAWREIQPLLDDALQSLPAKDREALILRFYRSLSVREVAATLGIAADAAQKRIDRATERLRGKLARRGLTTGGALSATLSAGFATDVQAAASLVPVLVSKSVAAGAAGTFSVAGLLTLTSAIVKSTSLIPPAVALVVAALWTGTKLHSLSAMEEGNARLRQRIDDSQVIVATSSRSTIRSVADDHRPIDWRRLATEEDGGPEAARFLKEVKTMTREELIAAVERVAGLECSKKRRATLESMVAQPLVELAPDWLLGRFSDHLRDDPNQQYLPLAGAFQTWAKRDLSAATAWLDARIAAGDFDSRSLRDKRNPPALAAFEAILFEMLLAVDPDSAARRLEPMMEDRKLSVMDRYRSRHYGDALENREHLAEFAALVRSQFTDEQRMKILFDSAPHLRGAEDHPLLAAYLDKIVATPGERADSMMRFAGKVINTASQFRKVDEQDLETVRGWFRGISPDAVETMTGRALTYAMSNRVSSMRLPHASEIALRVMERTGSDEALATLLETTDLNQSEHAPALELARRISDAGRRATVVKRLESLTFP